MSIKLLEVKQTRLNIQNGLRLVIIYRPPYSANHPFTVNRFLNDFATYLESIVLSPEPVLITGDFNIHVDDPDCPNQNVF